MRSLRWQNLKREFEVQYEAEISKFDQRFYSPEVQSCFPKGTVVHTRNGLVPIEQIQVGDWVLSKPEDGSGQAAYKQVTKTFEHPPEPVVSVEYTFGDRPKAWTPLDEHRPFILTTLNHPIWTMEDGWLEARYLHPAIGEESTLLFADKRTAKFVSRHLIFKTDRKNIGWISTSYQDVHYPGAEWDFDVNELSASGVESPDGLMEYDYLVCGPERIVPEEIFTAPVYNIEVDGWHTYFVGIDGLWVHNKNQALQMRVQNGGLPLPDVSGATGPDRA